MRKSMLWKKKIKMPVKFSGKDNLECMIVMTLPLVEPVLSFFPSPRPFLVCLYRDLIHYMLYPTKNKQIGDKVKGKQTNLF